jgi:phosphate transport system substrate-binding protein
MKTLRFVLVIFLVFLAACGGTFGQTNSQNGVSTYIQNKGSDTIVNLALAWAEKYQAENPDVFISVTGGGSGTGIAALLNRTVDIASQSRWV